MKILPEHIQNLKKQFPNAVVMVHPECTPAVAALADKVLSTEGMSRFAKETKAREIIVGTEVGMVYRLQKENPEKKIFPAAKAATCPNMKKTTLEKVLWSLEEMQYQVKVDTAVSNKAKIAIEKMLMYSRTD